MTAAIATDGLTKDYDSVRALDHLTIDVAPGEVFGFLGPNGAGKTTTIRLLLDLIRPTSGSATILGRDCHRESHLVRQVTGYLPGDVRLYPGRTGQETIDLVAGLRGHRPDQAHIARLARAMDLDLHRQTATLSKGNRQKLGILLAMIDRPEVYLLDEPTSGLDPILQRIVWDLFLEEAERGSAVFFSSHVMSEVEQVCERVAILRHGRIVAIEPISALKERALRRVELTLQRQPPRDAFALPEVRELDRNGNTVRLEVAGHLHDVIATAVDYHIVDLRTEQASLDEILLTYYQDAAS
jgi:ABC-2 type transport system ATP-binding protein